MIKLMGMEHINILMELSIKVNGLQINREDME
jgi:hypothetical protein